VKAVRTVRRGAFKNLPLKNGKALAAYPTGQIDCFARFGLPVAAIRCGTSFADTFFITGKNVPFSLLKAKEYVLLVLNNCFLRWL